MQTSDLYHHFLAQLQPLLNAQQSCFSVALSGGVDSVVLLHLMKQAQQQHSELKLEAVYVTLLPGGSVVTLKDIFTESSTI